MTDFKGCVISHNNRKKNSPFNFDSKNFEKKMYLLQAEYQKIFMWRYASMILISEANKKLERKEKYFLNIRHNDLDRKRHIGIIVNDWASLVH